MNIILTTWVGLLLTTAICENVRGSVIRYGNDYIIGDPPKVTRQYYYDDNASGDQHHSIAITSNRAKREVEVSKNADDTYKVIARKDFQIDDNRNLRVNSFIDGLKAGGIYNTIHGNVDYSNLNGNGLSLSAENNKNVATQLTANGQLNIFKTPERSLDAKGFLESNFHTKLGDDYTKYGTIFDFNTVSGSNAKLALEHDSLLGNKIQAGADVILYQSPDSLLNGKAFWTKNIPLDQSKTATDLYGGSLNYLNRNGNVVSLSAQHEPNLGDQLSAAAKLNLFHNDNHNLDVEGKFTRTFPINTASNGFNTYSGNVDYHYNNRLGVNLGIDHSDLNQRTDYTAMGNMNIFRDRDTSLDLNIGAKKTLTPSYSSPFEPNIGGETSQFNMRYSILIWLVVCMFVYSLAQVSMSPGYKDKYPEYYKFAKKARTGRNTGWKEVTGNRNSGHEE